MKRILLTFIAAMTVSVSAAAANTESMDWAAENGIIKGMEDGSLNPEGIVTRAQLAAMMTRFAETEPKGNAGTYADVDEDDWFYPYVISMSSAGIMIGDSGLWRPEDDVTREEAVTAVVRLLGIENETAAESEFIDKEDISGWAVACINTASENGLIDPDDSVFRPNEAITRSELAEVLYNGRTFAGYRDLTPIVDDDGSVWTPIY